ncbi:MAG: hypothetical protein QXO44_00830 [Thermoplasmatales archaeon]
MMRLNKRLSLSSVDRHRKFGCKYYSQCLTYAAKMNWPSFSCRWCGGTPAFNPVVMEIDGVPVFVDVKFLKVLRERMYAIE